MRLIKPNVEILEQKSGLDGIYKQIELAGRTCYKSEDKITEDSAKAFVDRMIASGHGAMLEHGTVYLTIPVTDWGYLHYSGEDSEYDFDDYPSHHCINPYTRMNIVGDKAYITTNYRVLIENNWLDDAQYICEPTEHHEKRITIKWTCDRGVSHEFVRHRVFSFAMESTRYCNYSKDKFGKEITFIEPTWYESSNDIIKTVFQTDLKSFELSYMSLLQTGLTAQQARQVLPNALKTELVMTGFESDWKHFFSLRSPKYGAKGVHPDAAYLADKLYDMLYVEKDSDFSVIHCDAFDGENPLLNDGDMITYHSGYDKNKNNYTLLGITIKSKDGETLYMNREEYYKLKEFQVEKEEEFLKNTRKQNRELCNNL